MALDLDNYRDQIESALVYGGGTHLFEDVVQMVVEGKAQAWVNNDSIAITEVVVYPRKKVLDGFIAAGKCKEIVEMMPSAIEWGRSIGCTGFTIAGRKGWTRILGRIGFRPHLLVLEREI
jgi:N-acyl-L-homoserine lactone synthetase